MSSFKNNLHQRGAMAGLLMSVLVIALSPLAPSQEISLSNETPTPTVAEENPFARFASHRKPIPVVWKIAIVLGVVIACSALLWVSVRVWRASNLFDRQYRFPEVTSAALRLGGTRSGGHMAVVTFNERAGPEEKL